jgi:Rrf2 family transcriptional regulator, nitric oxide-sensitive transcriptional repressor
MQLTLFSDYSLRTVIYLGVHRDRLVPIAEIARAYRISENHLVKVAHMLAKLGVIQSVRGRGGGLRLGGEPARINIGQLVRKTEPNLDLVECFNATTNTCPITPACRLKGTLIEARSAFLQVLDRVTLADLLGGQEKQLQKLWASVSDVPRPARTRRQIVGR